MLIAYCLYAVCILASQGAMSIGAAALFAAWLWRFRGEAGRALRRELTRPDARGYAWVSLALAGAIALSLVVATLWPLRVDGGTSAIRWPGDLGKIWYLAWPIVLATGLRALSEKERSTVLRVWFVAFGIAGAIGIFQHFTGWPLGREIPESPGRYHADVFFGHHLSAASILIFPFFVALDFLVRGDLRKSALVLPRWALAGAIALGGTALFFGYSRTLWVALPAGVALWLFLELPRRLGWAAAGVLALGVAALSQVPGVSTRLHDSLGVQTRLNLWQANVYLFEQRPLTGVGFRHNEELGGRRLLELSGGQPVFSGHAHDNLLHMLSGTGVLGALAWLAWCFWAVRLAVRARVRGAGIGLGCAWLVFHLNGLTQVNFWEGKVEHQIAWVVAWSLVWAGVA